MRALSGSPKPLELPCLVDQASCGEVYYITWTKQVSLSAGANLSAPGQGGQWMRVYLFTGSNDSAPHKAIGDLLNRSHFLMPQVQPADISAGGVVSEAETGAPSPPMAKLLIEDPRLSDDGLYKCDVTYVKGKCPSISLVRLHVLALPGRAQIFQLQGGTWPTQQTALAPAHSVGPFNEHDQLKLFCLVLGGRPAPKSVIWRKIDPSGRTINLTPSKQTISTSQNQNRVEVYLNHSLTSSDLGAKFECHVDHDAIERPSARVHESPAPSQGRADSMLDLHPSGSVARNDEQAGADDQQRSLDSHVFVDLNGKFSSSSGFKDDAHV